MMEQIKTGIAGSSLLLSMLSIFFTSLTYCSNNENKQADVFLMLHKRYQEIVSTSPRRLTAEKLTPNEKEWNYYRTYWYHSFSEWYVTKKLNPAGSDELWDLYFSDAQRSALAIPAYKKVACALMEDDFTIMESRKEYSQVLREMMNRNRDDKGCQEFKSKKAALDSVSGT